VISPDRSAIIAPIALLASGLTRVAPFVNELFRPRASRPRICVVCGRPIFGHDPFLRYRREYYHAEPCLEDVLHQDAWV
jgi:hypothetical protein